MKKRITVISCFVGILVLLLGIGLLIRGVDEKYTPLDSASGEVGVEDIDLSQNEIIF